jgi:hypothetical protein
MKAARLWKLHRAVDRHCAERVSITPMQAGGYVAGAPSGAAVVVMAYVAETSTSVRTSGNAANSGHNAQLLGVTHSAKFTTSELPFDVASGYVLTRLDDPALPQFRVSAVWPFGTDRTVLLLVKVTA